MFKAPTLKEAPVAQQRRVTVDINCASKRERRRDSMRTGPRKKAADAAGGAHSWRPLHATADQLRGGHFTFRYAPELEGDLMQTHQFSFLEPFFREQKILFTMSAGQAQAASSDYVRAIPVPSKQLPVSPIQRRRPLHSKGLADSKAVMLKQMTAAEKEKDEDKTQTFYQPGGLHAMVRKLMEKYPEASLRMAQGNAYEQGSSVKITLAGEAKDALALIEHGHIDQPGGDLLQIAACNQSTPTGHGGHGDPFHVISKEGEGYVAGGYVKLKVVGFPSAGRSLMDDKETNAWSSGFTEIVAQAVSEFHEGAIGDEKKLAALAMKLSKLT
ncbi:hypothetical protein AK812_SmicGene17856 [Symbiodinium microadriaticum]|uniref:Uncharacterized protein n=1 Tax=Symbiodinium microadriaticum TaxID=2951 RepID=A0A1Q9DWL9_SYMMI|nr:hypothetical protein AK812_SmicGene17856 [Symbiodinium microadriaticum]